MIAAAQDSENIGAGIIRTRVRRTLSCCFLVDFRFLVRPLYGPSHDV